MMVTVPVSSVASQIRGVSYSKGDAIETPRPGYVMLLRANNITDSGLNTDDVVFVPESRVSIKQRLLPGDIVVAASSGSLDVVGKAARVTKQMDATFGAFCKVVRPGEGVDAAYLSSFFQTQNYRRTISSLAAGANINNLRNEHIDNLDLPLPYKHGKPDLDEQKRIAALLDKADALRRKRQEALRLTDDFLRASFLDMFGDPLTNIRQLPMKPLREFGEIVTGNTPPRSEPENFGSAVEWIKSDNINTPNYYLTSAEERLSPLGAAKARKVPANSILVTCIAGSPSCIGNVALTNREVAFNQQINAVVPANDTDPFFLFTQFLVGKKKIQNASTNGMKGMVSKGTFSEIEFLAPPEAKQREFGNIFRHMEELHRKNEDAFTATETLFSALQQRAFSGEL